MKALILLAVSLTMSMPAAMAANESTQTWIIPKGQPATIDLKKTRLDSIIIDADDQGVIMRAQPTPPSLMDKAKKKCGAGLRKVGRGCKAVGRGAAKLDRKLKPATSIAGTALTWYGFQKMCRGGLFTQKTVVKGGGA